MVVTAVGAGLGMLMTAIGALLSPIGLVIAAVVALGAYLLWTSGVAGKALDWLTDRFKNLADRAGETFRGIANALATSGGGDIALAARILWLALKAEWVRGTNYLNGIWLKVKEFFLSRWTDAIYGALALAQIVWHALAVGWIETVAFLGDAWDGFVAIFKQTWETMKAWAQKSWTWIKSLFDDSIDVDAAYAEIDQERQNAVTRIEDETAGKLAQRELDRQRSRERETRQHEDTMTSISEAADEEDRQRREKYATEQAQTDEELAQARREWQAALDEAQRKRDAPAPGSEEEDAPDSGGPPDLDLQELQAQLSQLDTTLDQTVNVRGTFNAAALQGLMTSDDSGERTAQATEQTARNTRRIEQQLQNNQAAFE